MKRASYRAGVAWIAFNDEPRGDDLEAIAEQVSVALLADLFEVSPYRVAGDVLKARRDQAWKDRRLAARAEAKAYFEDEPDYDEERERDDFADPGGRSALRAAGPGNPRNLPCPNCGAANRLTPKDRALGYQCDACADRAEGGWGP